jgi:hypothetical protein
MTKVGPRFTQIFDVFTSAYKGLKLEGISRPLTTSAKWVDSPSAGERPFLCFATGHMVFSPWADFQQFVKWSIPAKLWVSGPGTNAEATTRSVLFDLLMRTSEIVGLPLDSDGKIVPLSDKIRTDIENLCERGAPYLTVGQVTSTLDGSECVTDLVFSIETTVGLDKRKLKPMLVGVLGTGEMGQRITEADLKGFGPNIPTPNKNTLSVNVTPYSASLTAGSPTIQLSAISTAVDYSTQYVTGLGSWTTTNANVATVSAGLVTFVGVGSCLIRCVFDGVASNRVLVTCA